MSGRSGANLIRTTTPLSTGKPDRRILIAKSVHPTVSSGETVAGLGITNGIVTAHFRTLDEARAAASGGLLVVDCGPVHIFPSFRDTHIHQLHTGYDLRLPALDGARTIDEIVQLLRAAAEQTPKGGWIYPSRSWHESNLAEQRLPTAKDLDRATTEHHIALRRGGHVMVANSRLLAYVGIDRHTPDPATGTIRRYADGSPTGILIERPAFDTIMQRIPPLNDEEMRSALALVGQQLTAKGVTFARDPGIYVHERLPYEAMNMTGTLKVRSDVLMRLDPGQSAVEMIDSVRRFGPPSDWAGRLRIAGVKLFVDGGIEGAATNCPYTTDRRYFGHQLINTEDLRAVLGAATNLGWAVGCHAVGDRAIDTVLEAASSLPVKARGQVSIEHALLATAEQIEAIQRLGLSTTLQHPLLFSLAHNMRRYWGPRRASRALPTSLWIRSGAQISGGSDCNVTDFDPMQAVWGLQTRHVAVGAKLGVRYAVPRSIALGLHCGRINIGDEADLIGVPVNLLTCTNDQLLSARPAWTLVHGEPVYDPQGIFAA
jgi:predicted amidohydrolase YtcJ